MVMGDAESKVIHAKDLIEAVLYADEPTRSKIRMEQLRTAHMINSLNAHSQT